MKPHEHHANDFATDGPDQRTRLVEVRWAAHGIDVVMATWRLYLQVTLAISVTCVLLPLGVGRDVVYCLVGSPPPPRSWWASAGTSLPTPLRGI